jgi:hypothetical protein
MNQRLSGLIVFMGLSLLGCSQTSKKDNDRRKIEFNQGLADELKLMAEIDQVATNFP